MDILVLQDDQADLQLFIKIQAYPLKVLAAEDVKTECPLDIHFDPCFKETGRMKECMYHQHLSRMLSQLNGRWCSYNTSFHPIFTVNYND